MIAETAARNNGVSTGIMKLWTAVPSGIHTPLSAVDNFLRIGVQADREALHKLLNKDLSFEMTEAVRMR